MSTRPRTHRKQRLRRWAWTRQVIAQYDAFTRAVQANPDGYTVVPLPPCRPDVL